MASFLQMASDADEIKALREQLRLTHIEAVEAQAEAHELREALAVERNHGDMRYEQLEEAIRAARQLLEDYAVELEGVIPLQRRVLVANLLWPEESGSGGTVAGTPDSDQPHGAATPCPRCAGAPGEVQAECPACGGYGVDQDAYWRSVGAGEV